MFFTIGKIQKQLKEVKASIHRERLDIPQFKYIESDCPGAQASEFDDSAWKDFLLGGLWGGYDKIAWFRARAMACNLLEEEETPVDHRDRTLTFPINPFEIKSFKVWF